MRRYLGGQACSIVGSWTQSITLSLLLWQQTQSPWMLGVLNFLLYGPALVVSPLFGARLHPQRVRAVAQRIVGMALALSLLLLGASVAGVLRPALILGVAAGVGLFAAMEMPARQLLLTTVLQDKARMVNAIALNTLVFNIGRMVGPAVAALIFSHAGASGGFAVSALGLSVMLLCLASLPPATGEDAAPAGPSRTRGLRPALAHVRADAFARRYLPLVALIGLFAGSYQTLIPVLASERFGDAARYTGLFFGCAGAGALLSGLMLASRHAQRLRTLLGAAPWACVLALALVALGGFLGQVPLAGVGFFALGLSMTFCATSTNALLQQGSPPALRGGMVGLYSMAYQGTMPLGHLIAGQLSSRVGVQWAFVCAAAAVAAGTLVLTLWARRAGGEPEGG